MDFAGDSTRAIPLSLRLIPTYSPLRSVSVGVGVMLMSRSNFLGTCGH